MANMLDPGNGGAPAPQVPTPNPPGASPAAPAPNPLSMQQPATQPGPSPMMTGLADEAGKTRALFEKMKEAEAQADAIKTEMAGLAAMADTVTTKDVVKAFAGIVAAGVPAVTCATILAEMPEQPDQLPAWVQEENDHAIKAEQTVSRMLNDIRHQMVVANMKAVLGHSVEAHSRRQLMNSTPAGRA